ncbi:transcriptional repressor TCF25 family protein [Aspergillus clavatus NRRL 1]|uniref:Nulp1-pending protein n=1 Tax=Aspergillus clavatus (strain ATCC 1007 / CBS 513.65 / DSM 816 / NCTC 3887 / NRRL 1 / QM 1276 / 107) TaxID=344612 RepID=A1CQX6_ASPCL|nr:Nulp1-pending protein [Aspergillus clavatus NRRL 1]EAW08047.1 Nulp1-pending protein [Aspergillus clavatus NRRL 1]
MSSRAIRKLQKLREQELQAEHENDQSSEDEPVSRSSKPKLNAFDLLNAVEDEEIEQESENEVQEETVTQPSEDVPPPTKPAESSKKKKKKNKKKKAAKSTATRRPAATKSDDELDEIDRALKELEVDSKRSGQHEATGAAAGHVRGASFPKTPAELLAIEPKFLNAMNEMRKLFGNVVMENFDQDGDSGTGRRRDRNQEMVDLGRALTGRYSPASKGLSLAGTTQRKNVFMQGKDEWPRAPSGGLGMELVEKLPDGATKYQIVHNAAYTDVQRQFDICVESMDPQRMIHLLQYNPYHISTLLQVSEIAKHQGDHAVSADLLERALFNMGRSVHSSFGNRLKEGQSRLDFTHMANRELWLVGWRYIANLGMKGTWRTAYEWAKLLLSLNDDDPYCIRLLIDHLALRGREYAHFIELCTQTRLSEDWADLPNIQCSLALAYLRSNKPKECRGQLRLAMSRYPWVFCRLAQELDIQPMPKRIWGKMPPSDGHELLTELYVARAKDLWNTPEAVSLIVEVADTLSEKEEPIEPPEITLDIARHVVLSDIPSVTTHLPGRFVSGRISASDPLPPYDSEAYRQQSDPTPSYLSQMPEVGRPQWLRDLLDQLNNGALRFPRFRGGEGEEIHGDDIPPPEDTEGVDNGSRQTVPDDQPSLEQWLLGDGMQILQAFLNQYGVDRGNWGEVVDYSPLTEYLDALDAVQPDDARQQLLHGRIREAMGDMVVDMLENELELQQYEDEEIFD